MTARNDTSPNRRPRRNLLACIVGMLAVFAMAFALAGCGKKQVEVPNLYLMDEAEAKAALEAVGLTLGTVEEKETDEILIGGFIIEQSPEAGAKTDEGGAVNIFISPGPGMDDPVAVPNVVGLSVEEAESALLSEGFIPQPGEPEYSDTVEPGKVCAQSVKAGSKLKMLETIVYAVSLGKEKVAVPDVTGKNLDEARDALNKAGLACDTTESYNDNVAKGLVTAQSVAANEQVEKGTVITIDLSLGAKPAEQVSVPNIYSYNLDAAKRTLESYGFSYEWSGDENGTVTAVNPQPGSKLDKGAKVTFQLTAPVKVQQQAAPAQPAQPESQPEPEPEPEPEVVVNEFTQDDLAGIIETFDLGDIQGAASIVEIDGVQYWEVDVMDEEGELHTFLIDPEGDFIEE